MRNLVIIAVTLGVMAAILVVGKDSTVEEQPAPVAPVADGFPISYELKWKTDGLAINDDGSWAVTSPAGSTVTVKTGYLVSYSVQLVECPPPKTGWNFFGISTAHAGHSGPQNPVAILTPQVESLTPMTNRPLGEKRFSPQLYCQAHYLIARAPDEVEGLPPETDLKGVSVFLEGEYQASAAEPPKPFSVRTSLANGKLDSLQAQGQSYQLNTAKERGHLSIWRKPATWFDRVDFGVQNSRQLERQLLTNIIKGTEFEFVPTPGQ